MPGSDLADSDLFGLDLFGSAASAKTAEQRQTAAMSHTHLSVRGPDMGV